MKSHAGPILAAALILLAPAEATLAQELTRQQMEEDLQQLTDVARRAWAYYEDKTENFGLDLDGIHDSIKGRLGPVKTKAEFIRLLQEYVSALQDGHASIWAPGVATWGERYWPFQIVEVKEGIMVRRLHEELGEDTGVEVGDIITEVDGRPMEDVIAEKTRSTSASTDGQRRRNALTWLPVGVDEESIRFTLVGADGQTRKLTVKTRSYDSTTKKTEWKRGPILTHKLLGEDAGYLQLTTFQPDPKSWSKAKTFEEREKVLEDTQKSMDQAFTELKDRKTLILDLRGNSGGTDQLGQHLARHLLPTPFDYYQLQTRGSPDVAKLPGWDAEAGWTRNSRIPVKEDPSIKPYRGRLLILIDESCFSATDNFLACIADLHKDVLFIGRPSGGGTGAPRTLATLKHSGAQFTITVMKVRSPKGRLIEGRGTKPDVEVRFARDDYLRGRDTDLETALAYARGEKLY